MNSTDPDLAGALQDFKRGGWVVSLLGGAGMLARLLLTDKASPTLVLFRKTIAGAIVGVIAYFAVWGQPISGIYKALILSCSGALSPEAFELLISKLNKSKNAKRTKRKHK